MLTKSITAACFIAFALIVPIVQADDFAVDLAGYPAELWRHPVKGVTVAMLIGYLEDGEPALRIYIKNSADKDELLPAYGDRWSYNPHTKQPERAIQAFYIKDDGTRFPLENYIPAIHSATNPLGFTMPAMPPVQIYHTGEMMLNTIKLSHDQLTMLRQYPVVCRFLFYPPIPPTMNVGFVETDPIKVSEKRDVAFRPYP